MTTVRELIDMLQHGGNEHAIVVLAADGQANGFSPLAGIDSECVYVSSSPWSGEVYDSEEDAEGQSTVRCVCLWPTN